MFSTRTKVNMARAFLTKNRPFYVQYYILSRCNLVCRQCNIVEGNSDLQDASLDTVEKIADNLVKIGAGVVLLTGGEPFLRKDLPQMVKIFTERGLNPRLQTAGYTTTRQQLESVREAGARDINISLDSLLPEKQDFINGSMPNSWKRAIETIVNANDIFDDKDRICAFGTVLSRLNFMEIPAIIELATFMGWYESLVPVHITSSDNPMNFRGIDAGMKFLPEDAPKLLTLRSEIESMKKAGYNVFDSEKYIDSMFYFIEHGKPNWRKNDVCDSPSMYFAILPNGDFAVCCDHRYQGKVSVADSDFPRIYKSEAFRESVMPTVKSCSGCNYGSYPEVTLSVRDPGAFVDRVKQVLFPSRRVKPISRSLDETFEYIHFLRNKYSIPNYEGPIFERKPAATSQRYGGSAVIQRGATEMPRRLLKLLSEKERLSSEDED
jgi:MoaA/NifB/PqqE/SkfB family radical SAM enzyme